MSLGLSITTLTASRNGEPTDVKTRYVPALPVPGTHLLIDGHYYRVLTVAQDTVSSDDFDLAVEVTVVADPAADLRATERLRAALTGRGARS